jgi:hypothetical protein
MITSAATVRTVPFRPASDAMMSIILYRSFLGIVAEFSSKEID